MKTFSAVFNLFAISLLVMVCSFYYNISIVIENEFNQARYSYACRQATEAMFRSTIQAEDLGLDYTDLTYATINASSALDIFDRVMCYNYDLSVCKENFEAINESIVCCVIAGYDGYYLASYYEDDTIPDNGISRDGYTLRFSPKFPYVIESGGRYFAVDTAKHTYAEMSGTNPAKAPTLSPVVGQPLPGGITDEDLVILLNSEIRDAILEEALASENAALKDYSQMRLYFPYKQTVTGVNPFEIPGIFVVMQGAPYANTRGQQSSAVAGYKLVTARHIILFTDTHSNRHYYAYQGQLTEDELGYFTVDDYIDHIADLSKIKATDYGYASIGYDYYTPYYEIMSRKIVSPN